MYASITLDWCFGLELAAATVLVILVFSIATSSNCSALVLLSFILDIVGPFRLLFHTDRLLPFLQVQRC